MNTGRSFLLFLVYLPTFLHAQIKLEDYSQSFPDGLLKKPGNFGLVLAIPKLNNSFWAIRKTSTLFDQFNKDRSLKELRPAEIIARTTFDTARVHFFLHGVDRNNASSYQFRVTEYPSRKVIVPWQSVMQQTDSVFSRTSGWPKMAYLGGYKAPLGGMLIMDVMRKNGQAIVATSLLAREPIRPVVSSIYTSADIDILNTTNY